MSLQKVLPENFSKYIKGKSDKIKLDKMLASKN